VRVSTGVQSISVALPLENRSSMAKPPRGKTFLFRCRRRFFGEEPLRGEKNAPNNPWLACFAWIKTDLLEVCGTTFFKRFFDCDLVFIYKNHIALNWRGNYFLKH